MQRITRKFKNTSTSKRAIYKSIGGGASLSTPAENNFDHPEHLESWFRIPDNKNQFFYGLAVILRYKENEMKGLLTSLVFAADKLSVEYKSNENNYKNILETDLGGELTEMKENMQEKVRENLNISYQTRYSELIQKKQAYELVIKNITDRRWYIVNSLQKNQGQDMVDRILKQSKEIYGFYRGEKYKPIRRLLYMHIKNIAETPATYQNSFVLNASITGPAGSGKTTLARQMGRWFAKLGILTYDSFFRDVKDKLSLMETGRSDLIAEFTGQTAPKTLGVLARSLERTLFIDEAYSVAGCALKSDDTLEADPYGEEFLAELLRFMNDHKGFNSMIVAGYENLMNKCFFSRNEGLPRRFPQQISLPFYSTDELYGIFAKNVALKKLNDISTLVDYNKGIKSKLESVPRQNFTCAETTQIDDAISSLTTYISDIEKRKDLNSYAVYYYLAVMKPSFMMIHYDTTYNGINTLRKYLTVLKMRHNEVSEVISWTILNHVFTNLLHDDENPTRKQLFRRKFYEEVFHFVESNLSYFPAQAGEMENLADECAKKLMPKMDTTNTRVLTADEENVINDYCKGKKIKVYAGSDLAAGANAMSASLFSSKAEQQKKADIEQLQYLMDEFTERYKVDPSAGLSSDTLKVNSKYETSKSKHMKQIEELKAKITGAVPLAPTAAQALTGLTLASDLTTQKIYELSMVGTSVQELRRRIHNFLELDDLFATGKIPSLTELWTILNDTSEDPNNKRGKIIKHIVRLYTRKISAEYIESILGESEKRFPIHLNKSLLETEFELFREKVDLDNSNCPAAAPAAGDQDKIKAQKKWQNLVCAMESDLIKKSKEWRFTPIPADPYQHKEFTSVGNDTIKKEDILYEDFGISKI